jgi:hypothetical protein
MQKTGPSALKHLRAQVNPDAVGTRFVYSQPTSDKMTNLRAACGRRVHGRSKSEVQ